MKKTTNQAIPQAAASLDLKRFDFIEGTEITTGSQSKNQTLIFKDRIDSDLFKISIKDDSYKAQSYARLEKWSDQTGWMNIMTLQVHELMGGSIANSTTFSNNHFWKLIIRLQELAYKF